MTKTQPDVAVRIQSHPSRAHLLPALGESLRPLGPIPCVHSSDPPSPLAGYRLALQSGIKDGAPHIFVIQDDATVCRNFAPALMRAIELEPNAILCLFLARLPAQAAKRANIALKRGRWMAPIHERQFIPVVATVWPTELAADFYEWSKTHLIKGKPARSDDGAVARWNMTRRYPIFVTVPSLVQHEDRETSTIGKRAMWGKDRGRTALHFLEDGAEFGMSSTAA